MALIVRVNPDKAMLSNYARMHNWGLTVSINRIEYLIAYTDNQFGKRE